jgi:predicted nucleic acid-binding protein
LAAVKILVETGFLLALNPRDRNHKWAMGVLEDFRRRRVLLHISPVAPLELALILRSRKVSDNEIRRVLQALDTIVSRYGRPGYPPIDLKTAALAADLRSRHRELTFFDSMHAAVAIANDLVYYDLDEVVKDVVSRELGLSV